MDEKLRTFIGGQLDGAALIYESYHRKYAAEEEIHKLNEEVEERPWRVQYAKTLERKKIELRKIGDIRIQLAEKHRRLAERHIQLAERDERLAQNCYRAAEHGFKK